MPLFSSFDRSAFEQAKEDDPVVAWRLLQFHLMIRQRGISGRSIARECGMQQKQVAEYLAYDLSARVRSDPEKVLDMLDRFDDAVDRISRRPKQKRQPKQSRVSYYQTMVQCGNCTRCKTAASHGPYWYARERINGRRITKYIGKTLPTSVGTNL